MANGKREDLYLMVVEDRSAHVMGEQYFHLRGRLVTQKYESGWVPSHVDDDYSSGLLYSGLRVSCQGDERSRRRDSEPVYGMDVVYHEMFSVDTRKARRMARTLDTLERGLIRISERRGHVASFGDYCGRIAEVFGCKGIGVDRGERSEAYRRTGNRWEWHAIGDGINRVNSLIWQWRREAIEADEAADKAKELDSERA